MKPYAGTESVEGIWYFKDKVTYEKDRDTLKVSIEFGHDPRKDQRKHVIMMSVDQSKYLEYDEVTHVDMDGQTTISRTFCKTSAPDKRRHLLAEAHAPLRGDSHLDEPAQAFHQHVRRNLLGFGHLHINLPLEQHQHLNNVAGADHQRRALRADDGALNFESPMTDQQVEGKALVKTVADVMSLSEEFTEKEAKNLLAKFSDGTYLSADLKAKTGLVPKSIITSHTEDIAKGKIEVCICDMACLSSTFYLYVLSARVPAVPASSSNSNLFPLPVATGRLR